MWALRLEVSLLQLIQLLSAFVLVFTVDFLAKYCIFNQEALAEYRKVFEEVSKTTNHYIAS